MDFSINNLSVDDAADLLAMEIRLRSAKQAAEGPSALDGALGALSTAAGNVVSPPQLSTAAGTYTHPGWGAAQAGLLTAGGGAALGAIGSLVNRERRKHWLRNAATMGLYGGLLGTAGGLAYHGIAALNKRVPPSAGLPPAPAGIPDAVTPIGRGARAIIQAAIPGSTGPISPPNPYELIGGAGVGLAADAAWRRGRYASDAAVLGRIRQLTNSELSGAGVPAPVVDYVRNTTDPHLRTEDPGVGQRIRTRVSGVSGVPAGQQLPTNAQFDTMRGMADAKKPLAPASNARRAAWGLGGAALTAILARMMGGGAPPPPAPTPIPGGTQ